VYSNDFSRRNCYVWTWFVLLRIDAGKVDLPTTLRNTLYAVAARYHPNTECREQITEYRSRAIRALKRKLTTKVEATEMDLLAAAVLSYVTVEGSLSHAVGLPDLDFGRESTKRTESLSAESSILWELRFRFQRNPAFNQQIGVLTRGITQSAGLQRGHWSQWHRGPLSLSKIPVLLNVLTFSQRLQYFKLSSQLYYVSSRLIYISFVSEHIFLPLNLLIGCMRKFFFIENYAPDDRELLAYSEIVTEVARQLVDTEFRNFLSDIRLGSLFSGWMKDEAQTVLWMFDTVILLVRVLSASSIMNGLAQAIADSIGDESVRRCLDWIGENWNLSQHNQDYWMERRAVLLLRLGSCFVSDIAGTNFPFDF